MDINYQKRHVNTENNNVENIMLQNEKNQHRPISLPVQHADLQTSRRYPDSTEQHMGICSDYLVKPQRVNFVARIVDINGSARDKRIGVTVMVTPL